MLFILAILQGASAIFRKCCPAGHALDIHSKICISSSHGLSNNFTANVTDILKEETTEENLKYEISAMDSFKCDKVLSYHFEFSIAKEKSVYYIIDSQGPWTKFYLAREACIDEGLDIHTGELSVIARACVSCSSSSMRVCANPVIYPREAWNITITGEVLVRGTVSHDWYCVETREHTLVLCPVDDSYYNCLTSACFIQCCPAGQIFHAHTNRCISISDNTSTLNITESFEEEGIEENLLYEALATDTYECKQYLIFNFHFPVSRGKSGKYIVSRQGLLV